MNLAPIARVSFSRLTRPRKKDDLEIPFMEINIIMVIPGIIGDGNLSVSEEDFGRTISRDASRKEP